MKSTRAEIRNALILNSYASVTGGATRVAIDEARALADRDIRVKFFAAVGPVSPELRHENIEVICLLQQDLIHSTTPLRSAFTAAWNLSGYRKIKQAISECRLDDTIVLDVTSQ